jgi:gliding motility-associated-like protein
MKAFRYSIFFILVVATSFLSLSAQILSISNVTTTPTICSDGDQGSISFDISGGTGPYNWYIYEGVGLPVDFGVTPGPSVTSLGRRKYGLYLIGVQDSNLDVAYMSAAVGGPEPMLITSYNATDLSCNNFDDGTLTVTATGETGSHLFDLAGPVNASNATGVFTGLSPGIYTITARDAGICTSTDITAPLTINNPTVVSATTDNIVDASCFGEFSGSIAITPGGGTPSGSGTGYSYLWSGPSAFSSTAEDITGLEAGDYFVSITDGNGCSYMMGPYTVGQPTQINVVLDASTDVICHAEANGTASITTSGGAGGYIYSWVGQSNGLISNDEDPINLPADTYDLTITDASTCSRTITSFLSISEPDPLSILVDASNPVSCNSGNDGSAQVTAAGGTPNYSFSWTGATSGYTSIEEDPTGMPADVYSVSIVDDHACSDIFSDILTIDEPDEVSITIDDVSDVTCLGANDGTAQVTATGGTLPYAFTWVGVVSGFTSSDEDPNDLPPDTYHLVITDANTCPFGFWNLITINEPPELDLTIDLVSHVDCNGDATGSIDITPLGGTPAYSFAWSGPDGYTATTEDISGLAAGTYNLILTDVNGCIRDFPGLVTITENPAITASFSLTDLSCGEPFPSNDGAIDASISGGAAGYIFTWSGPNGFTAFTEDISGLEPGSYVLEVMDVLGCTQLMNAQVVGAPPLLTATSTSVDIDCFGAGNGSIDLTVTGGTAPYGFAWNGPSGYTASTEDISSLEAGSYSVTVTDLNGCPVPFTDIAIIDETSELTVTAVKTDISCGGLSDGTIDITVSGGTLPYVFAWTGPSGFTATTEDLNGLAAGSYSLTITDGNSCVYPFPDLETIFEPSSVLASYVSHVDVLCHGDATGSIEIDVSGGQGPYVFDWTTSLGNSVSTLEDPMGLTADSYSLQVTDDHSCVFFFSDLAIISEAPLLEADLSKTDVSCFNDGNGSITVSSSGGSGSHEYSIDGSTYQPGNTFGPLIPGFYTIWTRDANLCVVTDTITIVEPEEIQILEEIALYLCHGALQGEISINGVSGGLAPYEYSINGGTDFSPGNLFTGLAPGSYQTVVRDASGCLQNGMLNILVEPPLIQIASYTQTDISSCSYAPEGSVLISGTGGTGIINYSLDGAPPVSSGDFQDLPGGTYVLTLIDDNSCTLDTTVEILAPSALAISNITVNDVSGCFGDSNGSLEVTAFGGTGSLEFSLDDVSYQPGGIFSDLTAGEYIIWLRDMNACFITDTVNISEPAPILATIETTNVFYDSLGSIRITNLSGGTPPYEYSINGMAGPFSDTSTYTMLQAASYTVIVRDINGCTYEKTVTISDTPPMNVLVNVANVVCHGDRNGSIEFVPQDAEGAVEFSIDSGVSFHPDPLFENLSGNITYYLVARDDSGKVFNGAVYITEPPKIVFSNSVTRAECNAFSPTGSIDINVWGGIGTFTYLWSDGDTTQDRSNLLSGVYSVLITDGNNCTRSLNIAVNSEVSVEVDAGEDVAICTGTSIQLQGSGTGAASWDPSPFLSDENILNPVVSGMDSVSTFVLTITETASVYNCYNVDTVRVDLYPLMGLDAGQDTFVIKGNSVQLEARGGPFEMYRWEPVSGLDDTSVPDPIATPMEAIRYYVYAYSEYGCEEVDSVYVDFVEDLQAYNVFSPNGDGINEYFEIRNAERYPEMLVEIYSRWGDLIFSTVGYGSGNEWDGTARGKEAPLGTYYYIIVPYQGARPISGNVTIIR